MPNVSNSYSSTKVFTDTIQNSDVKQHKTMYWSIKCVAKLDYVLINCIVNVNNQQTLTLYLYLSQEKLTMLKKQLYWYASKHQASKRRFDGKQRAGTDEQVSGQQVYTQIGFPV
jgi:hypothetical protein